MQIKSVSACLAVFVSVSVCVCLSFGLCALNKHEGMCVGPLGWC